jgi:glutamine synthetase
MKPDLATLRRMPWLEGRRWCLPTSSTTTTTSLPHSPARDPEAQVARLAGMKMSAFFASELEFYLFDETYESAGDKGYTGPQDRRLATSRTTTSSRPPRKKGDAGHAPRPAGAGIPVENSKGEWGPGQEEINVRYADALTMADRHVILKNGIKEIASLQGKAVTFMAKWRYDLAGSSSHIHVAVGQGRQDAAVPRPKAEHGMSPLMRHFVAGQLAYAREITWFLAPYINSYKRFQVGTFAPTKAIWSPTTAPPASACAAPAPRAIRIECRIGGADLNPYLAFAALLAAGLAGIEEKLELEPPYVGDAYHGKRCARCRRRCARRPS